MQFKMAILEILLYFAFAWIMYYLAKKSENFNPECIGWDRYIICFMLFFSIICAFRWRVGGDCTSYALEFISGKHKGGNENSEVLWESMVQTFAQRHIHWSFGFGLVGFIQILMIVLAVRKYPQIFIMLPFVMFGGRYFQDMAGAVRQMTVACGFLWASKFIYQKKLLKYIAFVYVGTLIHGSAIILLPFYFIPKSLHFEKRRYILISILLICWIIGLSPAYQSLGTQIEKLSLLSGYENYSDLITNQLEAKDSDEALSFGPMMLTYLIIPIFVIWFGPKLREKYCQVIPYFDLWYNLAYFYACIYFLVCNLSHIFIRITLPFNVFQMVMASLLLYYLINEFRTTLSHKLIAFIYCFVIFMNSGWQIYKATDIHGESVTYKVFFNYGKEWKPLVQKYQI